MQALGRFWLVVLLLSPVVALVALPPFGQRMVTLIGIYALMGLGYQLVFGQLGALNLAQGALFGIGAYAAALAGLPVAPLAAAIPAALAAALTLRLQSHYFALATLALASLVNLVALHAESLTGGANGLAGFAAGMSRGPSLLVVVWAILIAGVVLYARLFAGTLGERARLLREAPLVAATLGIDAGRWRLVLFVLGGALAGLAGAFSAALSGVRRSIQASRCWRCRSVGMNMAPTPPGQSVALPGGGGAECPGATNSRSYPLTCPLSAQSGSTSGRYSTDARR